MYIYRHVFININTQKKERKSIHSCIVFCKTSYSTYYVNLTAGGFNRTGPSYEVTSKIGSNICSVFPAMYSLILTLQLFGESKNSTSYQLFQTDIVHQFCYQFRQLLMILLTSWRVQINRYIHNMQRIHLSEY